MELKFSNGNYLLTTKKALMEINLTPYHNVQNMSNEINISYGDIDSDGRLNNYWGDMVGIIGLKIGKYPNIPRILWDNREHHFWDGFVGAFETRRVVVCAPVAELKEDLNMVCFSYYYIANGIKTSVSTKVYGDCPDNCHILWDTEITVENKRLDQINNYCQFFASYHPYEKSYYWDHDNSIQPCDEFAFSALKDEAEIKLYMSSSCENHTRKYAEGKSSLAVIDHNQKVDPSLLPIRLYHKPVLISEKQEYYGNKRHVTMVDEDSCASIVTWHSQARDYMIKPPNGSLAPGQTFTAHIRHLLTDAESRNDLEILWDMFQKAF